MTGEEEAMSENAPLAAAPTSWQLKKINIRVESAARRSYLIKNERFPAEKLNANFGTDTI